MFYNESNILLQHVYYTYRYSSSNIALGSLLYYSLCFKENPKWRFPIVLRRMRRTYLSTPLSKQFQAFRRRAYGGRCRNACYKLVVCCTQYTI